MLKLVHGFGRQMHLPEGSTWLGGTAKMPICRLVCCQQRKNKLSSKGFILYKEHA